MKYLNIQTVILGSAFKYAEPKGFTFGHTLNSIPQSIPDKKSPEYLFRKQSVMLRRIAETLGAFTRRLKTPTINKLAFPASIHPQLYAYICSASIAGMGRYFDRAYMDPSSHEYINAHINFCNYYGLDPTETMRIILLGEELTYLLNVTDGGAFADTVSKDRILELTNASITSMDRYGDPYLSQYTAIVSESLWKTFNFDFRRVL